MDILIKILQFVLSFSLLVIIHEFGHFLFARIFKTRVEKFYLFFNPWFSLFKFKKGETEYGIGWVPLGGYVKIAGMIDESMDTEQMKQPVQPYEFRAKPAWQRLLIMVGGVLMNVVLAVCIYIGISYAWGETYVASKDVTYGYVYSDLGHQLGFQNGDKVINVAGEPVENSLQIHQSIVFNQAPYVTVQRGTDTLRINIPEDAISPLIHDANFMSWRIPFVTGALVKNGGAAQAGLQKGDRLIALNGEPLHYFDEYQKALATHKGEKVTLSVSRDSAGITRTFPMEVQVSAEGTIGVYPVALDQLFKISTREYSFWEAIPAGLKRTGTELANYGKQLKLIFSPKTEAYKSVGGILSIGSIFPDQWNWLSFWQITALLSIMLAVLNILPIPLLDGGHVLFLLIEVITGRKPSEKVLIIAQNIGLVLVLALMLYANGNDIYRFFIK